MKRCLPMPQRYIRDHHDHKDRTGNLERSSGAGDEACGYQRNDCSADLNMGHFYRFEETSGTTFQDEIGSDDLSVVGNSGDPLELGVDGISDNCIRFNDADWGTPFGTQAPEHPEYASGLFSMATGDFAIGCWVYPSSTHGAPIVDNNWIPLVGQGSGELAGVGDYEGMLYYSYETKQIAVCFNHYQFHTASKDGNPRDQYLNGHFKTSTALLTEDAWNRVLWVHDDAANGGTGAEKLYVNSATLDSSHVSEDGGLVGIQTFAVGHGQWADHFFAHFFGADEYRGLGGGSKVDNVGAWLSVPTADEITGFMTGSGNLAEAGSWVIVSGHSVAKSRVKVNGT